MKTALEFIKEKFSLKRSLAIQAQVKIQYDESEVPILMEEFSQSQNSELLDKVRRMEEENVRLKDISEKAENLISVIYMDQRVQTFWTRDKYPKVFEEYESAKRKPINH